MSRSTSNTISKNGLLYRTLVIFLIPILVFACKDHANSKVDIVKKKEKPTVSFTFDDGSTNDIVDYKFEDWNELILSSLREADLKSVFFVSGANKTDQKGKFLLAAWDRQDHRIANHTFSHPSFGKESNTPEIFEEELLRTDSIINQYQNYVKYFRFPYLKEGQTREKIDKIRSILKKEQYQNGYVTIDASDWYVNSRLIKKMRSRENVDTLAFRDFYLSHIMDRAKFYESLSFELNGRHIKHTLLLHHNLTSALFLSDLIKKFESEGWEVIDAIEAYKDPIYESSPKVVPAGESLIWSLAKESGKFEDKLRYPAEDSRYEEEAMDGLGL